MQSLSKKISVRALRHSFTCRLLPRQGVFSSQWPWAADTPAYLAWTVPWVEKLLDTFRWRIRSIKHLLSRKRSTAERLTLILREILERPQIQGLLDPTIVVAACKVAQDFQSWFFKMQWERNQTSSSPLTHNVRENTDRTVIRAENILVIGTIWAERKKMERR